MKQGIDDPIQIGYSTTAPLIHSFIHSLAGRSATKRALVLALADVFLPSEATQKRSESEKMFLKNEEKGEEEMEEKGDAIVETRTGNGHASSPFQFQMPR